MVHIAFHWLAKDDEHPDSDYGPSQTYWIFKRDIDWSGLPRPANGVDPTSVKRGADAAALLASFGAEPPDNTVLVATFPIEALRTDGFFVIYRTFLRRPAAPPYPVELLTDGEILPDELRLWK